MGEGLVLLVLLVSFYFLLPIQALRFHGLASLVVTLVLGLCSLYALLIGLVFRFHRKSREGIPRTLGIAVVGALILEFFAGVYFVLQSSSPGQFTGLATRLDALYFALSVLATTGFGDVHASGQMARALVALQMVFNLAFLGSALASLQFAKGPKRDA